MAKEQDTKSREQQSGPPSGTEQSYLWLTIQEHYKKIILVLALIILAAAISSGYQYYRLQLLEQARQDLAEINMQLQGQEKIQALEELLQRAPQDLQKNVLLELANTAHEQESLQQAENYWDKLAGTTQDPGLKTSARLGQVRALSEQNDLQQALEILDSLLQKAPQAYQRSINFETAALAEQAENWDKALEAYQNLAETEHLESAQQEFLQYKISQLKRKMEENNA